MKYIAVFFILNVLLLSTVSGVTNIHHRTASCCKQITDQRCSKQPRHASDNDCSKGSCNAMLSCSTCGFLIAPPVSFLPAIVDLSDQIAHPFNAGELSDYQDNYWNPPKA